MFMLITLSIILENPNIDVSFALQKGSGSRFEVAQRQQSKTGEDLCFELTTEVKPDKNNPHLADFRGPFIQGTPGERFIYLNIGKYAGAADEPWDRRLKIPLTGISMATANDNVHLITHVSGQGKDGTPNCATVKPFVGWKLK
ncbi:hypothetical protein C8P68_104512 [Mucilaginibacter yixingensis]|uniref:Uncharacterized protein n=2 Tax=Mucilaginibacter yixingensis TaxID=1295612 RepID=A0A2T5JAD5_9SPHI|nr:DUF5990 family protein [Mucilaginibacter yixingensis]PTQ97018.1 hypothetical protein C8P68_104512 [Mucilaginibacter yixingensis]